MVRVDSVDEVVSWQGVVHQVEVAHAVTVASSNRRSQHWNLNRRSSLIVRWGPHSCSTSSKATLPDVLARKLPFSHRRLLVLVPPPQEREQLDLEDQLDNPGRTCCRKSNSPTGSSEQRKVHVEFPFWFWEHSCPWCLAPFSFEKTRLDTVK